MVQPKGMNGWEPKPGYPSTEIKDAQSKTGGSGKVESKTIPSAGEVGRRMIVLQKAKTPAVHAPKVLSAAKQIQLTPDQKYQEALKQGLYIAGKEGWFHRIPHKIHELQALGPKAGRGPADIAKDVATLYDFVYDTRLRSLLARARRGDEGPSFLKELTELADYGVKAGKSLTDITADKKKIYQEFFNWAYAQAQSLAHRHQAGPDFHDRLTDMDRYGLLGGFLPSDVAKMKQIVLHEFYASSLRHLKRELLARGCDHPNREIVLSGSTLTVKGRNYSGILSYGSAAGLSPADMNRDVENLKDDIQAENRKHIVTDLVHGVNTLLGVQRRAAKGLIRVAYRGGREIGEGVQQIGRGVQRLAKEI